MTVPIANQLSPIHFDAIENSYYVKNKTSYVNIGHSMNPFKNRFFSKYISRDLNEILSFKNSETSKMMHELTFKRWWMIFMEIRWNGIDLKAFLKIIELPIFNSTRKIADSERTIDLRVQTPIYLSNQLEVNNFFVIIVFL